MRQRTIDFSDFDFMKCQVDGGIQGEHRATQLKFIVSLENPDEKTYKLVFEPGGVSQTLNAVNGEIFYEIPQSVSLLKKVKTTLEAYEGDLRIFKSPVLWLYFAPSAQASDPTKEEQDSFRAEFANLNNKLEAKISELSNNSCNPLLQKVKRSTADIIELTDVSPQNHLINAKIYKKNLITYPYKDGTSKTTNGIKFSVNPDGTIKATGTGLPIKDYATFYLTDNIAFLDGETYSLAERTVVSFEHNGITKYFGSWNSPFVWHEAYKSPCVYAEIPKGDSVLISTIKPQIELGEVSTEYEKGLEPQNIKVNVYDNIKTKTEYTVDSRGLVQIKSISPKMKIEVNDKTLNIAFAYQRDINDGIKENGTLDPTATGDYEKLKNLPKINGEELKGNLIITKETLGVKDGAKGDKGDTGDRGTDGVSPTISFEAIEGGNRATVTDVNGTSTFDILNGLKGDKGDRGADGTKGKDGTDGVSPIINSQPIEGGTKVTISDSSGEKSFDVLNGQNGKDGKEGPKGESGPQGPAGSINGVDLGVTGAKVGQIIKIKSVDESGKPTGWEPADSAGGAEKWEKINEITFNGETGIGEISTDSQGKPFELIKSQVVFDFKPSAESGNAYFKFYNGTKWIEAYYAGYVSKNGRISAANADVRGEFLSFDIVDLKRTGSTGYIIGTNAPFGIGNTIHKFRLEIAGNKLIGAGSKMTLYGVRK